MSYPWEKRRPGDTSPLLIAAGEEPPPFPAHPRDAPKTAPHPVPPRRPDSGYARDASRASGLRTEEDGQEGVDQVEQLNVPLGPFDLSHADRPIPL